MGEEDRGQQDNRSEAPCATPLLFLDEHHQLHISIGDRTFVSDPDSRVQTGVQASITVNS